VADLAQSFGQCFIETIITLSLFDRIYKSCYMLFRIVLWVALETPVLR